MSRTARRIARALGAGGQAYGQSMMAYEADKEKDARADARAERLARLSNDLAMQRETAMETLRSTNRMSELEASQGFQMEMLGQQGEQAQALARTQSGLRVGEARAGADLAYDPRAIEFARQKAEAEAGAGITGRYNALSGIPEEMRGLVQPDRQGPGFGAIREEVFERGPDGKILMDDAQRPIKRNVPVIYDRSSGQLGGAGVGGGDTVSVPDDVAQFIQGRTSAPAATPAPEPSAPPPVPQSRAQQRGGGGRDAAAANTRAEFDRVREALSDPGLSRGERQSLQMQYETLRARLTNLQR